MLKQCDLFAGVGGFTVAGLRVGGIQTTQLVEINRDAQLVLRSHWPDIPLHNDIRTYHPPQGSFDIITCGFPCTGTSNAGRREGLSHPESALWREGVRCVIECRPRFFVIEQPEGLTRRGLRAILGAIRMAGYHSEVELITAAELGAGHRRPRIFVISYPYELRGRYQQTCWKDQMREFLQGMEPNHEWLTAKRKRNGSDYGVSVQLVRGTERKELSERDYTTDTNTPGRIRARYLAGRTVTPAQAAVALHRVLSLSQLSAE